MSHVLFFTEMCWVTPSVYVVQHLAGTVPNLLAAQGLLPEYVLGIACELNDVNDLLILLLLKSQSKQNVSTRLSRSFLMGPGLQLTRKDDAFVVCSTCVKWLCYLQWTQTISMMKNTCQEVHWLAIVISLTLENWA